MNPPVPRTAPIKHVKSILNGGKHGARRQTTLDRRRICLVRSGKQNNDDGKDKIDWNNAWTDYRKQQGSGSMGGSRGGARRPPGNPSRSRAASPLDEIKRAEDGVLSPWSSALFAQLGIGAVVLLLIAVVAVGGADIHDSRCTLPWC